MLVPNEFSVPKALVTDRLRLRMLGIHDVVKDYLAVVSSLEHLRDTKPFGPEDNWPPENLTLEQDLVDLGWHQREFENRSSFAYSVMSLDEQHCLGCVYIYPSPNPEHDAQIVLWVRQSELENGLDEYLFGVVQQWIGDLWPFNKPGYPGREIPWEQWLAS